MSNSSSRASSILEKKVELIDGILYEMPPQSNFHSVGVRLTIRALDPLYKEGFDILCQMPLALGFDSEPEPDIAVVPGHPLDYLQTHPRTAVLVVEVADSSLMKDRKLKTRLYARAGIPEYWILNVVRWCLEVHREPKNGVYTSQAVLREGDNVSPLTRPEALIPVASLLPRK